MVMSNSYYLTSKNTVLSAKVVAITDYARVCIVFLLDCVTFYIICTYCRHIKFPM